MFKICEYFVFKLYLGSRFAKGLAFTRKKGSQKLNNPIVTWCGNQRGYAEKSNWYLRFAIKSNILLIINTNQIIVLWVRIIKIRIIYIYIFLLRGAINYGVFFYAKLDFYHSKKQEEEVF